MPRAFSPFNSALQYEAKFVCLFFLFPGKMEENELLFKSAAAAAKLLQSCLSLCDPRDGRQPTRQEHWSGLPFPSPMHESEN